MTSDNEVQEVPDSPNELKMYRYWIAFASMGFLVGNIAGLTSAPITQPLLAAVLAFGGGSIIAFQTKLNKERLLPGALDAVAAFSLATLIGLYSAFYVTAKHPSLFLPPNSEASSQKVMQLRPLPLRSGSLDTVQEVLRLVSKGTMTPDQGLETLKPILNQGD